ncbi:MAG TPA: VOC family protein [Jiangellaceae bacterium]|nr:VOC family protein [Jiangellaceae bacterium]
MALVTWRSLHMDAVDPAGLAGFWSVALGLEPEPADDGGITLRPAGDDELIRIDPVDEEKTVKHRVHVDIDVGDVQGLLDIGATIVRPPTEEDHWWVMADVAGGEFCAFVRDARPPLPGRLYEVVVDCRAAVPQAKWWAEVLGLEVERDPGADHDAALNGIGTLPFDYLCFTHVPEPKSGRNRVRWDVACDDPNSLRARGARDLDEPRGAQLAHGMADPEGNEFGVVS